MKCDYCNMYHKYLCKGLCKECFWKKHVKEMKQAEDDVSFYEQFDNSYGGF